MYEPRGKDYFKNTGKAMGVIYIVLAIIAVYCLTVIILPNFAKWCWNTINSTIDFFSKDNPDWGLFVRGFFWSCTGALVVAGIVLKIMDYIKLHKKDNVDDPEEIHSY